jgi:hypothetical protein
LDSDRAERAKRYRKQAAEIRAAGKDVTHRECQAALIRLAESYDRLAARIEQEIADEKG